MFTINDVILKEAVNTIAIQALQRYSKTSVVQIGGAIDHFLQDFRRDHPEKVPTTKPGVGLLGEFGPYPVSDFELASHLVGTRHKAMVALERMASGMPILMAYLAVASLPSANQPNIGWVSALQYAVGESSIRVRMTQKLEDAVEKYRAKEMRSRERASVGGIKGAKTRKESAIQPSNVVEAAKKLGWPESTDGVNKRLSSKFNCTADHIGRILRKAKSDM